MPHAVTHILFAVVLIELFRDYSIKNKKDFPLKYILIGGIAALTPDVDVVASWVLYFSGYTIQEIHRNFTHTLILPAIFLVAGLLTLNLNIRWFEKRNMKLSKILFVISFAITTHLLLDSIIFGTISPFYPITKFHFGLDLLGFVPSPFRNTILPALDGLVFVFWLIHLGKKHKISSFF